MIEGSSLRTLSRVTAEARGATRVRFVVDVDSVSQLIKDRTGLSSLAESGDAIIPGAVGKVTEFNARGKEIPRKDLPLIKKSIPVHSTWKDWHGYEHSGIQFRDYDVYQRDYVRAPSEEIELKVFAARRWYASKEIDLGAADVKGILHLANVFLEIFGRFEVLDAVTSAIPLVATRRLQWEILPPGNYPWSRMESIVRQKTGGQGESAKGVIEERLKLIAQVEPDFMATGRGGYSGYFVFGFSGLEKYVLESVYLNNATYIFGNDWEVLSSLTKDQIINGDIDHERIIHDRSWRRRIWAALH